ncbi:hypothetical protein E2C01_099269 [Portunus trituberculatus]|uniref:Uncharacterized protein n=1 Tax=Portunus trituberculatus TaxID=210409 RepID=A0A5B7KAJ4_PORTR|nr:hypothetical protein [Portunus trituberculatus]
MVNLIANCICGTFADYLRAYRTVFLASITSLTSGLLAMYWIPELLITTQASEEAFNITFLENATLSFSAFLANNSALFLEVAGVNPNMTVGEIQQAPFTLQRVEETTGILEESEGVASLLRYPQFWLIVFILMLEQIGLNTCIMITDSVCFLILGKGLSISLVSSTTTTINNNINNKYEGNKFIMVIVIIIIIIIIIITIVLNQKYNNPASPSTI